MFEKLIGLSFISLICDILLSGSQFKKYIKTVMGALFILTVISGIMKFDIGGISIPDESEFMPEIEEYEYKFYEDLREEVVLNTEKAIKDKLESEKISIEKMIIDFNEDYSVKKIEIYLTDYSKDSDKTIELLVNYFKIDKEVISLCQG